MTALRRLRRWFRPVPAAVDMPTSQLPAGMPFELCDLQSRPRHLNQAVIRGLCRNAYLGDHTAVCRILGRYRVFVDTRDVGLAVHLLTEGYWEMAHTEAMASLVRPGMKVADVGANVGYFTMLMSELVGETGQVHAFEPNPDLTRLLTDSVEINGFAGRTTVHSCALGARNGRAGLSMDAAQPKNAFVVGVNAPRASVEIDVFRLDGMAGLQDLDFLKIDVEGSELGVWRGMSGLLDSGRPLTIILEFTAARYKDAPAFVDEILAAGFSLAIIHDGRGVVPTTREEVLARPPRIDQLLVLRR